ncbi:MAG: hypothetical protein M1821_009357 [Bathelium mastoideum]|nr:MAG: hypothetical protein M1821_009357 [Bathelium mastoideum]
MASEMSPFLEKLPAEVRNKIYAAAVKNGDDINIEFYGDEFKPGVPMEVMLAETPVRSIFQLNQQIRNEAIVIFYRVNDFNIVGKAALTNFINFVGDTGLDNIRSIHLGTSLEYWGNSDHNTESTIHWAMVEGLYHIIMKGNKEHALPEHNDLNDPAVQLTKFKNLHNMAIEYTTPRDNFYKAFTAPRPLEYSAVENDWLHLFCIFVEFKKTGYLGINPFGYPPKPRYGRHQWYPHGIKMPSRYLEREQCMRVRWLCDEATVMLRSCGHDAKVKEFDFQEQLAAYSGGFHDYRRGKSPGWKFP